MGDPLSRRQRKGPSAITMRDVVVGDTILDLISDGARATEADEPMASFVVDEKIMFPGGDCDVRSGAWWMTIVAGTRVEVAPARKDTR